MSEWQPIDTAPKDGTVFFGFDPEDRYPQPMKWEEYEPQYAEEQEEPGYWTYAEALIADVVGEAKPTHWMPLPPPPESDGGTP